MRKTQPGDLVLGRYQIQSLIQEGGQGLVWKGEDRKTGKPVALKELTSESRELRRRFERENSVRLESPHIIQPYESGEFEGSYFLVMEFVDGQNLKQVLDKTSRIPEPQAVSIVRQVASGLDQAHYNNIIHRDIKPENIMLDRSGVVKITDFGIACFLDKDRFTRVGSTLGTAHYMSPEQVEDASKVDASSDLFSLGVVFYELVTGKKPFDGAMMGDLFLAIVSKDPIPPRKLAPEVSEKTEEILGRLLKKRPLDRYTGMGELLKELSQVPAVPLPPGASAQPAEPPKAKERTGVPCPHCRAINKLGSSYCLKCGKDLREPCRHCQNAIPPGSKFCRFCGTPVVRPQTVGVLVGLKGAFSGERIPVDKEFITIGRHSSNDISFGGGRDDYVSRFHARIFRESAQFLLEGWDWVKQEVTTNGTFINGKNMDGKGKIPLKDGDRVRLGDSFFRYETVLHREKAEA